MQPEKINASLRQEFRGLRCLQRCMEDAVRLGLGHRQILLGKSAKCKMRRVN